MDKSRFSWFYEHYLPRIHAFVYFRVGGNRAMAEDLTQEIFLKAFEAFERFDPARGEVAWLYTIARNHLINHYAKIRPDVSLEEAEGSRWASNDVRDRFASDYDERRLLKAMDLLPEEDARLIRMKYLEGWSFDELVELFGKKSAALRVQAGRALKKMRGFLKHPSV